MTRILVVDDQDDMRVLMRVVLEREGTQVTDADGGPSALEMLASDPLPDLVLLDVQMPDMDGWHVLERIRTDPRTRSLPVLMCTVKASAADEVRGLTLGCDGYVRKPFHIEDLRSTVKEVLGLGTDDRVRYRSGRLTRLTHELTKESR